MANFLNDNPILGPLAIIILIYLLVIAGSMVVFLFQNPDIDGAWSIAVAIIGWPALGLLNIRKLKGIE